LAEGGHQAGGTRRAVDKKNIATSHFFISAFGFQPAAVCFPQLFDTCFLLTGGGNIKSLLNKWAWPTFFLGND
jgi:hypothetical protein